MPPPDLTLEQIAARLLAESQDRRRLDERMRVLSCFMDIMPVLAWAKDATGRFVYVNSALCRRFERPPDVWLGRRDSDLWPPAVAEPAVANDMQVLVSGRTLRAIETAETPDGSAAEWLVTKFRFEDAAGHFYIGGVGVDLTGTLRSAVDLQARQEELDDAPPLTGEMFMAFPRSEITGQVTAPGGQHGHP